MTAPMIDSMKNNHPSVETVKKLFFPPNVIAFLPTHQGRPLISFYHCD